MRKWNKIMLSFGMLEQQEFHTELNIAEFIQVKTSSRLRVEF